MLLTNRQRELLDQPLLSIGLAIRTVNILERAGVYTVEDLLRSTPTQLLAAKNIGEKTLCEIYAQLQQFGFFAVGHKPRQRETVEERRIRLLRDHYGVSVLQIPVTNSNSGTRKRSDACSVAKTRTNLVVRKYTDRRATGNLRRAAQQKNRETGSGTASELPGTTRRVAKKVRKIAPQTTRNGRSRKR